MFTISQEQYRQLHSWMEKMNEVAVAAGKDPNNTGAIGGRYTYSFTPTGLGIALIVSDALTKQEINLTDYDSW